MTRPDDPARLPTVDKAAFRAAQEHEPKPYGKLLARPLDGCRSYILRAQGRRPGGRLDGRADLSAEHGRRRPEQTEYRPGRAR